MGHVFLLLVQKYNVFKNIVVHEMINLPQYLKSIIPDVVSLYINEDFNLVLYT